MADSYCGIPGWKFCRSCRDLVADMGTNTVRISLCTACLLMVDRGPKKEEPAPEAAWTIDQECWRLESFADGGYRLTKKPIAEESEETASVLVSDDDLCDLAKVLAARGALED